MLGALPEERASERLGAHPALSGLGAALGRDDSDC